MNKLQYSGQTFISDTWSKSQVQPLPLILTGLCTNVPIIRPTGGQWVIILTLACGNRPSSRWQRVSAFRRDLISSAFISLWQPARGRRKETLQQPTTRATSSPAPPPPPPSILHVQIQPTAPLYFWTLRAKHLLRFVRQSDPSPRGAVLAARGRNSWRCGPRPARQQQQQVPVSIT